MNYTRSMRPQGSSYSRINRVVCRNFHRLWPAYPNVILNLVRSTEGSLRIIIFLREFISSLYSCRYFSLIMHMNQEARKCGSIMKKKDLRIRGSLFRSRVQAWWHWCDPIIAEACLYSLSYHLSSAHMIGFHDVNNSPRSSPHAQILSPTESHPSESASYKRTALPSKGSTIDEKCLHGVRPWKAASKWRRFYDF